MSRVLAIVVAAASLFAAAAVFRAQSGATETINISEREIKIQEENFRRAMSVRLMPSHGREIDIRAGAEVTARRITVLLQNVEVKGQFTYTRGELTRRQQP